MARILRRVGITRDDGNRRDASELFRRTVFDILVDNTDDHEKNHSLLVSNPSGNGRLKLSSAYDVLPTDSGQGYQEFVCRAHGRKSTLENAMSQYEAFGLLPAEAAGEVAVVISTVNIWQEHVAQARVTARDIESLAERIDGEELLNQRNGFDPARSGCPDQAKATESVSTLLNQPLFQSVTGDAQHLGYSTFTERSRSALAITLTDDRAMAAAATTGDNSNPKNG